MRLIDADEIRWVEHRDADGNLSSYKIAFSDEMPPVIEECKWIPCSERLPEYGESVLSYLGENEEFEVNFIIDEEDGVWFHDGVTAWMPLPEPFQEVEHDNQ